jgi:hypothetical protein
MPGFGVVEAGERLVDHPMAVGVDAGAEFGTITYPHDQGSGGKRTEVDPDYVNIRRAGI